MKSWGYNLDGQLGTGDTANRFYPATSLFTDAKSLRCGFHHCFGIQNDGDVFAWGNNSNGQLGVNGTTNVTTPVQVTQFGSDPNIIPAGFNTFARGSDGVAYLWGNNGNGQIGNGSTANVTSPQVASFISSGDTFRSSGTTYTMFLQRADGTWQSWGYNIYGQLGLNYITTTAPYGATTPQTMPNAPIQ